MIRTRRPAIPAILGGLFVAAALLVPTAPAAAAGAAPSDTVYSLLNDARWADGQRGLLRNAALDQVAADWAASLAAAGTLSHNPDYASQIPGGWSTAGENVAQGHPDAGSMHAGWMASPGHRANILGAYTDVGVAFLSAGGTTWGVQVFAAYPGHVGPAAPGAVSGSQVAESPPPGEPAQAEVSTPESSPTPTVTSSPESSEPPAAVAVSRDDAEGAATRWWIAVLAGVVALAGAAFWWIRRRRATS